MVDGSKSKISFHSNFTIIVAACTVVLSYDPMQNGRNLNSDFKFSIRMERQYPCLCPILGVHAYRTEARFGGCTSIVLLEFKVQGVGPSCKNFFVLQVSFLLRGWNFLFECFESEVMRVNNDWSDACDVKMKLMHVMMPLLMIWQETHHLVCNNLVSKTKRAMFLFTGTIKLYNSIIIIYLVL